MLHFTVYHNDEPIKTYEFSNTPITLGRLPENKIPIASISISRRHCEIERNKSNQFIIKDLNSLNGTYVNSNKITTGQIKDGDKITIGKYSLFFEVSSNAQTLSEPYHEEKEILEQKKVPVSASDETSQKQAENSEENIQSSESKSHAAVLIKINKHVIYKIDKDIMTIGSSDHDDVFVEGFMISDGHALIEKKEDGTYINANKLMGKFKINGKKVNHHKLEHKDRIEIGTSTFRYMENGQKE